MKQFIQLSPEEQDKLNLKEKIKVIGFNEPIPKTNFCQLCQRRFDDYITHISTNIHKNNLIKNPSLLNNVKNTFERINLFWNEKKIFSDGKNETNNTSSSTISNNPSLNDIIVKNFSLEDSDSEKENKKIKKVKKLFNVDKFEFLGKKKKKKMDYFLFLCVDKGKKLINNKKIYFE